MGGTWIALKNTTMPTPQEKGDLEKKRVFDLYLPTKLVVTSTIPQEYKLFTLSPGMFFADIMGHLPGPKSDVVLRTMYPGKGSHWCCESPKHKHYTQPITWPFSLVRRCIKATITITDPSFGVVISTISHWDSSTQIIFHNTIHKHSDWQKQTWLSLLDWRKMARGGVVTSLSPPPAHEYYDA